MVSTFCRFATRECLSKLRGRTFVHIDAGDAGANSCDSASFGETLCRRAMPRLNRISLRACKEFGSCSDVAPGAVTRERARCTMGEVDSMTTVDLRDGLSQEDE